MQEKKETGPCGDMQSTSQSNTPAGQKGELKKDVESHS